MCKKILKGILLIAIYVGICVYIPVIVEEIIVNGIGGLKVNTYLGNKEWFSFYGSYLGSIITIVIFFLTLRKDKKQIIGEIKKQKIKEEYSSEKEVAKEIVSLLSLDKFYSNPYGDLSFFAVNVLKNDIRRVKLLVVSLRDCEFTTKVKKCIQKYDDVASNYVDELNISLVVFKQELNGIREYYLKSEIDDSYIDFLDEIEKEEIQELNQIK